MKDLNYSKLCFKLFTSLRRCLFWYLHFSNGYSTTPESHELNSGCCYTLARNTSFDWTDWRVLLMRTKRWDTTCSFFPLGTFQTTLCNSCINNKLPVLGENQTCRGIRTELASLKPLFSKRGCQRIALNDAKKNQWASFMKKCICTNLCLNCAWEHVMHISGI